MEDVETGVEQPWHLKDLRKTCATYYDEHLPESSIEILGHSIGSVTYRHYALRRSPDPHSWRARIHSRIDIVPSEGLGAARLLRQR